MNRIPIPGTDLQLSPICLGTGSFGSAISLDESFRLLDTYAELGGNFLDTAHVYAAWLPNGAGASERTIGAWMKARGVREKTIVGTKGAHPHLDSMHVPRMSRAEIVSDLNESLERLQANFVDLYWLHRDAPAVPVGEILGILNELIAEKRIGAIGCSNWTPRRQRDAAEYARKNTVTGFCASQIGFSLAKSPQEVGYGDTLFMADGSMQFHRESGTPLMAYSSQANGFFSGKYTRATPRDKGVMAAYGTNENVARLERAQGLAQRLNRSANQIALGYVLSQSFPSVAIVGSRTVEQVTDSCRAADLRLSAADLKFLEG